MLDIMVRAGCFISIILLGFILKKVGFFKDEDFKVLSKIVVKITLTAAIVTNFSGKEVEPSMFLLTLIGFGFGVVLAFAAYLMNRSRGRQAQAFYMVNTAGCNVGNFSLPFAQNFLGPVGVMAVGLFDVGNAFICLGGVFGVASVVKDGNGKFSLKPIFKALSKSTPFLACVIMTILCMLHITLPSPVLQFAEIVGNANAFLAMFMIGVGFRLSGNSGQLKEIARTLGLRYALGISLALITWFFVPFPLEYKQALVILFLAPLPAAAPAFTSELDGDYGLASAINSISILISIALITTALVLII